jgi:hypothetical protein
MILYISSNVIKVILYEFRDDFGVLILVFCDRLIKIVFHNSCPRLINIKIYLQIGFGDYFNLF